MQRLVQKASAAAQQGMPAITQDPTTRSRFSHQERRMRRLLPLAVLAGVLALMALAACGRPPEPATPTASLPTPTPTPTIPYPTLIPTATTTPEPTLAPTPNPFLGLGPLLFEDHFLTDDGWNLGENAVGGASILNGSLVIAVRSPSSSWSATRLEPNISDIYVETQARAYVCKDGDAYGVMLRITPRGDHYRCLITCDGRVGLWRQRAAQSYLLLPISSSEAVIPGAPATNRIAMIASQTSLRCFVNGIEVLATSDPGIVSGNLGLFVQSAQSDQTTVYFDYLLAREIE
jgi:hypothetical protein